MEHGHGEMLEPVDRDSKPKPDLYKKPYNAHWQNNQYNLMVVTVLPPAGS